MCGLTSRPRRTPAAPLVFDVKQLMQGRSIPCRYCTATKFICFWGELVDYKPWRRPVLLVLSILLTMGMFGLSWLIFFRPTAEVYLLISVPMALIGFLGCLVSVSGCDSCVVRLWGDV